MFNWFKRSRSIPAKANQVELDHTEKQIEPILQHARQYECINALPEAIDSLERILDFDERHVLANLRLGILKKKLGHPERAVEHLRRVIDEDPEFCEGYYQLGTVLLLLDQVEEAVDCLQMAIHLQPDNADAYIALIKHRQAHGDLASALELCQQWRDNDPESALAYYFTGQVLAKLQRIEQAIEPLEKAVALEPSNLDALNNLGYCLVLLDRNEAALEVFNRALRLQPRQPAILTNMGCACRNLGRFDEALEAFGHVLQADPSHFWARNSRAQALLSLKRFREGWLDYEARFQSEPDRFRTLPFPIWKGEALAGKTIFIYAEQGLGDEIMFASMLPDIIGQGGSCIIECDARLENLFRRSFPKALVVSGKREDLPAGIGTTYPIDFKLPIGSLGRFFRNVMEDFPQHTGYLQADDDRTAFWKQRLEELGPGLKIGFSWRGGTKRTRTWARTISLNELLPIFRTPHAQFINLQYGNSSEELNRFKESYELSNLHHWQDAIDDYDETAALVSALDLVITVCTSIVHLTGALGKPAWIMTPYVPEWRYMVGGEVLPWYPASRTFRQARAGEWTSVIDAIASELNMLSKRISPDAL